MCIVVIKQKGVPLPDKHILQICWDNNPDGAGYMLLDNGKVRIEKGFMYFDDFYTAITNEGIEKPDPVVMHFRISTSGTVTGGCTHPYPASKKVSDLLLYSIKCDLGMAHNGIISSGEKKLNDTQLFIRDILSEPCVQRNLNRPAIRLLIEEYIGASKLAFLSKSGKVRTYGSGWIEDKGIVYSNDGFEYSYMEYGTGYGTGYGMHRNNMGAAGGYDWRKDDGYEDIPPPMITHKSSYNSGDWEYLGYESEEEYLRYHSPDEMNDLLGDEEHFEIVDFKSLGYATIDEYIEVYYDTKEFNTIEIIDVTEKLKEIDKDEEVDKDELDFKKYGFSSIEQYRKHVYGDETGCADGLDRPIVYKPSYKK